MIPMMSAQLKLEREEFNENVYLKEGSRENSLRRCYYNDNYYMHIQITVLYDVAEQYHKSVDKSF